MHRQYIPVLNPIVASDAAAKAGDGMMLVAVVAKPPEARLNALPPPPTAPGLMIPRPLAAGTANVCEEKKNGYLLETLVVVILVLGGGGGGGGGGGE